MDYFITVVGLLIFSIDDSKPYSFYVKWDDVQSYKTKNRISDMQPWHMDITLKDGSNTSYHTFDDEFWFKLIKSLNVQMMTEVMWNDKQAKVEVNCEK